MFRSRCCWPSRVHTVVKLMMTDSKRKHLSTDQIRVFHRPGLTRPPGDGKTFHGFQLIISKPPHSHAAKECRKYADENVGILHNRSSWGSIFVSSPNFEMKHSIPHQWHQKSHHRGTRLGSEKLLSSDSGCSNLPGARPSEPGAGETAPKRKKRRKKKQEPPPPPKRSPPVVDKLRFQEQNNRTDKMSTTWTPRKTQCTSSALTLQALADHQPIAASHGFSAMPRLGTCMAAGHLNALETKLTLHHPHSKRVLLLLRHRPLVASLRGLNRKL